MPRRKPRICRDCEDIIVGKERNARLCKNCSDYSSWRYVSKRNQEKREREKK